MTTDDRDARLVGPDAGAPGASARGAAPSHRRARRKQLPVWQESILLLGVALVLAIVIKAFFVQAFYIPSESMEPGLVRNDRILVQKPSYWAAGTPQRGDVIVFKDPGSWLTGTEAAGPQGALQQVLEKIGLYPSGGHLVKRVIGVAGDEIVCCDEKGRLSVNGVAIDERGYTKKGGSCAGPMIGCSWRAGPVPPGHVFVMGDNRNNSADSTVHMCRAGQTECVPGDEYIPVDLVVGKVFVLVWPRDHFRWVGRPQAFQEVPDGP